MVTLLLVTWSMPLPVIAQVTIEGGLNRQQRLYIWTITNNSNKPITAVRIPHYRAVIFTPPAGWEYEITNKNEIGMKMAPGVITAQAGAGSSIFPSRAKVFTLSFAPGSHTAPGTGVATITFADGTSETIDGVEVPWRVPWFRRHALLIGFGAMFAVFLFVQVLRGRRKQGSGSGQPSTQSG